MSFPTSLNHDRIDEVFRSYELTDPHGAIVVSRIVATREGVKSDTSLGSVGRFHMFMRNFEKLREAVLTYPYTTEKPHSEPLLLYELEFIYILGGPLAAPMLDMIFNPTRPIAAIVSNAFDKHMCEQVKQCVIKALTESIDETSYGHLSKEVSPIQLVGAPLMCVNLSYTFDGLRDFCAPFTLLKSEFRRLSNLYTK